MDPTALDEFSTVLKSLTTSLVAYYANSPPGASTTTDSTPAPTVPPRVLPSPSALDSARSYLHHTLPSYKSTSTGPLESITSHLLSLLTAFPSTSTSAHYYGFITGGVTPAALIGDYIASTIDQNVQVHLPKESLATEVEQCALSMLAELLRIPGNFKGRAFTTGATGSNVLGLAAAREALVDARIRQLRSNKIHDDEHVEKDGGISVGELGLLEACHLAGIGKIQILTAGAHSSIPKATSIIGLGRSAIIDISRSDRPWEVDVTQLQEKLNEAKEKGWVSVVVLGMGEVNTGYFPAAGEVEEVMSVTRKFGGVEGGVWVHVDAAFGIFARVFMDESQEDWEAEVGKWANGLELVDSITGDAHKLLNVPYDCGFFFTRDPIYLQHTFINMAPYLSSGSTNPNDIPSPLNIQMENSRRFRALPVYATLAAYGVPGYRNFMRRCILHARAIARYIGTSIDYELLPDQAAEFEDLTSKDALEARLGKTFMVVLFRAKDEKLNEMLKERINETGKMYVSGTVWEGKKAVRCAVGNWRVRGERDGEGGWGVAVDVLEQVARGFEQEKFGN
ncbi:PLP-dependent transferase [Ascodesmis nigricans]|uniref:PLP-dependent transferase n=1 Tax=Ascodesmis nigricans TaxID=341454 RepID=A0A4S2N1G0_9PEZI|nr:PLP-dependent transferase [Ascodesmis nigricans]